MPRYNYYCDECDDYFELTHSMSELLDTCLKCESSQFIRIPSIPAYVQKAAIISDKKVGSLVEEYIEKNRKSVEEEKKKLKNQEYKK